MLPLLMIEEVIRVIGLIFARITRKLVSINIEPPRLESPRPQKRLLRTRTSSQNITVVLMLARIGYQEILLHLLINAKCFGTHPALVPGLGCTVEVGHPLKPLIGEELAEPKSGSLYLQVGVLVLWLLHKPMFIM